MQVELKVSKHPSGRHTLMQRKLTQMTLEDCDGDLFANPDVGSFYKAVAAKLAALHANGDEFSYQDMTWPRPVATTLFSPRA